ncbi:MAG: hypothetical protein Q7S04_01835 [Candidatus Moranbacteria bacterium]|nr:hypothetical protein [Candidatus Moranbacteria bacterium]
METFRIGEAIKYGWGKTKAHFLFLWMVLGIVCGVAIFLNILSKAVGENSFLGSAVSLGATVLGIILQIGLIRIYIDLIDQDKEDHLDTLFSQTGLFWRYLGASILYYAVVVVGFILLIIPGIYFSLKYQFYGYLIIDKNFQPFEALKKSAVMTVGIKWKLLGFSFALVGLNIAGALLLVVGLLVTIPISILAYVYVYRELSKRLEVKSAAPAAVEAIPSPVQPGV